MEYIKPVKLFLIDGMSETRIHVMREQMCLQHQLERGIFVASKAHRIDHVPKTPAAVAIAAAGFVAGSVYCQ